MQKLQISSYQMFVLIVLFELGTAVLFGPGATAKQDAWIANLLGLAGGVLLFLIYYRLFTYYPELPLTSYVQKILGKWAGSLIAFFYISYFLYQSSRVLRDIGELLVTTIYTNTPLIILNTVMIITIMYGIFKGFEVIARVGELCFIGVYLLAILGFFTIIFTEILHIENLKPILENGWSPVLKTVLRSTTHFPFGEMVILTMLLPFFKNQKKVVTVCLSGMILSGINIAITSVINVAVLGVELFIRSPFPLYNTIRKIELTTFIQRLDIFFILYLIVAGFFKLCLYYYVAVIGAADLFKLKDHSTLIFPLGVVIIIGSMTIASNYSEHIQEGMMIIPYLLHMPFQVIIPIILLIIAFVKGLKSGH
ncbi:GerAB/ArcD/ProY family transporter [Bacillus sp. ISL-18]|uniref:GerAB/ArcD/ProY family transporter n=1 Tax=Bacillus sp. ISL-18 TaxID=2819118 RepID=UPI001BEC731D|nr:GerAB/ArcD/ProY family transporter [Bacillus sp. ISL-18]MBT2657876.1 GerAB/ArcD/ProY family transporter [Bacillus sp. ISL-18]